MAKLTYTQEDALKKIGNDWGPLPPHCGCTSLTLKALKNRGLIEMRGINPRNGFYSDFQVRRTPQQ